MFIAIPLLFFSCVIKSHVHCVIILYFQWKGFKTFNLTGKIIQNRPESKRKIHIVDPVNWD